MHHRYITGTLWVHQQCSKTESQAHHRRNRGADGCITCASRVHHRSITAASEVFQGCFRGPHKCTAGVSKEHPRYIRGASPVPHRCLTGASQVPHRCLTGASGVYYGCIAGAAWAHQGCIRGISGVHYRRIRGAEGNQLSVYAGQPCSASGMYEAGVTTQCTYPPHPSACVLPIHPTTHPHIHPSTASLNPVSPSCSHAPQTRPQHHAGPYV